MIELSPDIVSQCDLTLSYFFNDTPVDSDNDEYQQYHDIMTSTIPDDELSLHQEVNLNEKLVSIVNIIP